MPRFYRTRVGNNRSSHLVARTLTGRARATPHRTPTRPKPMTHSHSHPTHHPPRLRPPLPCGRLRVDVRRTSGPRDDLVSSLRHPWGACSGNPIGERGRMTRARPLQVLAAAGRRPPPPVSQASRRVEALRRSRQGEHTRDQPVPSLWACPATSEPTFRFPVAASHQRNCASR